MFIYLPIVSILNIMFLCVNMEQLLTILISFLCYNALKAYGGKIIFGFPSYLLDLK